MPELGLFDDAETVGDWTAAGFQLINNELAQKFALQLIEFGMDGSSAVREVNLDDDNVGEARLAGFGKALENVVLVVTPLTRGTYMPARYTLSITAGGDG
ncbi:MAG: hypothetical protein IIC23_12930 [Chloroflexi bacterium]|nr:hypothetical protein [Chloroflexota bacterium]